MQTMTKEKERQLNIKDRCDRCNAQAFYETKGISGSLLWCGHHFAKYKENLEKWAYEIIDEYENIDRKDEFSV